MFARIAVVMLNTYREAVRARLLHGLFALAIATAAYAVVVGEFASRSTMRVVSDLGAASISLYAVIVAVVIAATSLYRELELKTIFPILARPIHRGEYLVGKYLGVLFTLSVFIAANVGVLLLALAFMSEQPLGRVSSVLFVSVVAAVVVAWRVPRARTYVPAAWALVLLASAWQLAKDAPEHRQVLVFSALLTVFEIGIVAAIATVFAAFSSPFLSAVFTFGVFVVGRSADTLANMPERVFGSVVKEAGHALSVVVPNLMVYVPPRPLLTGETTGVTVSVYVAQAGAHAIAWSAGLLAVAIVIFKRRDFV